MNRPSIAAAVLGGLALIASANLNGQGSGSSKPGSMSESGFNVTLNATGKVAKNASKDELKLETDTGKLTLKITKSTRIVEEEGEKKVDLGALQQGRRIRVKYTAADKKLTEVVVLAKAN